MKPLKLAIAAILLASFLCSPPRITHAQTKHSTADGQPLATEKQKAKVANQRNSRIQPDRKVAFKEIVLKKGEAKTGELSLHVYTPSGHQASDQAPAIVFFFGGGWNSGMPRQFFEQSRFFADHGFVAFSAEYRVKSRNGASPFDCVEDGKSAIRWVRTHAKEFGIDPNKIVAAGGSAGGHVAACTGVIEGHNSKDEDLTVSSVPNAMVLFNPVLDTTKKGYGAKQFPPERQTEISPNHHIHAGIVPTILFHGTADSTVPFDNAETFTKLMTESGNVCELKSFKGKGHGFFNGKYIRPKLKDLSSYERTVNESLEFLTKLGFVGKS